MTRTEPLSYWRPAGVGVIWILATWIGQILYLERVVPLLPIAPRVPDAIWLLVLSPILVGCVIAGAILRNLEEFAVAIPAVLIALLSYAGLTRVGLWPGVLHHPAVPPGEPMLGGIVGSMMIFAVVTLTALSLRRALRLMTLPHRRDPGEPVSPHRSP